MSLFRRVFPPALFYPPEVAYAETASLFHGFTPSTHRLDLIGYVMEPKTQAPADRTGKSETQHLETTGAAPQSEVQKRQWIRQERQKDVPQGGIARLWSALGNLPEWKIRGQMLRGTQLNWGIGFIASMGFLMFGYGTLDSTVISMRADLARWPDQGTS